MVISCLGFNTIALFSRQIFKIDEAPVNASLIFWFCFAEMICSVPRNSPTGDYQNIWLTGEHSEPWNRNDPYAGVRTDSNKAPRPCRRFFKLLPAPTPISSRFLARLYYVARPTKTAMLRRLIYWAIFKETLVLISRHQRSHKSLLCEARDLYTP